MSKQKKSGFTLVELLVVIGIIALLISMLMPALTKAQAQSRQVACESNLRQIGVLLLNYSNENNGQMFPYGYGANFVHNIPDNPNDPNTPWPYFVFKPAQWNPKLMVCPSDLLPVDEHSYVLNAHLEKAENELLKDVKYSTHISGFDSTQIVVMGEKQTSVSDYYMDRNDFKRVVEPYRHGITRGSNYLFLDMHVGLLTHDQAYNGLDPWDPSYVPDAPVNQ